MHYIGPNLMILPDSNPRMISKLFRSTLFQIIKSEPWIIKFKINDL